VSTLLIVLIVVFIVVAVLAIGGYVVVTRRRDASESGMLARTDAADQALAAAFADDKGWDRRTMEGAAQRVWVERHPGDDVVELHLIAVVDLPGTDEDRATFHVQGQTERGTVTLARRGNDWLPS
jgi:hypothetical protein